MVSFWIICQFYLVFFLNAATSITNPKSHYIRNFRHISYQPHTNTGQIDWELGLRESVSQALGREHYHDPNIRKHILNAPLLGKQDRATPFGDIAILARGQLFVKNNGYVLVQDPYQNDCDDCHTVNNRCGHLQCEVWYPKNGEQLVALWTVKRIRHRNHNRNPSYEIEYTVSPINHILHRSIAASNGRFNYAIPGHVFVIRHEHANNLDDSYENKQYNRHKIVTGGGHRHVPGFFSGYQTQQPTTANQDIYHELINALNQKTTKQPQMFTEQTKSSTQTTTAVTKVPKTTLVQFPTGEFVPIEALTSPYVTKTTSGYVSVRFPQETTTYVPPTTSRSPIKTTFHFFSASEDEVEPPKKTTEALVEQPQKTTYVVPQITQNVFTEGYSTQPMHFSTRYTSASLNTEIKTTNIQQPTTKYTTAIISTTARPFSLTKQHEFETTSTRLPATFRESTTRFLTTPTQHLTETTQNVRTATKPRLPTIFRESTTGSLTTATQHLTETTENVRTATKPRLPTTFRESTTGSLTTATQHLTETTENVRTATKPRLPTTFRESTTGSLTTATQHLTETTQNVRTATKPTTVKEFDVTTTDKLTTPKLIRTTIDGDGTVTVKTTPILTSTTKLIAEKTTVDNDGFESTILTTQQNGVLETTRLKTTRLKPVYSTTPSGFLTGEVSESRGPQYTRPVQKEVGDDDIFGSTKLTTKSGRLATKKYVVSDIEKDLFGDRKSKSLKGATRLIYSDFYEASTQPATMGTVHTTERYGSTDTATGKIATTAIHGSAPTTESTIEFRPVTRRSYSTSISFQVNKRRKSTLPEPTTETIFTDRMDTTGNTKEAFDELALKLVNHARTIDILGDDTTTSRKPNAKRRRKYVTRVKRPTKKLKKVVTRKDDRM